MYIRSMRATALICGRFLSPLCKAVKMRVIPFLIKLEQEGGRRGEGKGGEGRGGEGRRGEGGVCVCMFASAMFVNAIQQC